MPAPEPTALDYRGTLLALLPTGPVWPRDPDAVLPRVAQGIAVSAARLHARANVLLRDSFPATTNELLPDWEASLGLPDECDPTPAATEVRRARVVSRLAARGGQSIPYLVGVAAQLGYTITISEFIPARVGFAEVGDPILGDEWAHAFVVHAPEVTVTYATAGTAQVGDPLASWGNASLECAITRVKPAHTIAIFSYGG